ncbi:cyclic nucleotide-binding domain-containing protein, partial [Klebsiella pneumoniae]|nr:cyclic nucleotide-binding domain-containing protein [Klebsiella pneumoniae]
ALLTGEPRTATAIAATDTRLLAIRKEDFDKLLDVDPIIAKEMLKVAAQRQAATGRRVVDRDSDGGSRGRVFAVFGPRGG